MLQDCPGGKETKGPDWEERDEEQELPPGSDKEPGDRVPRGAVPLGP